jgi:sigma-B regulation protein RsbU (phosphoserine phosphatase)
MDPALNVGGDFYDFYFVDENKIMFLVADVSGKGIPAALFMMIVKTIVSGIAQYVDDIPYAMKCINERIYANNKHNFFVTMLSGIFDLESKKLTLVNCGHNPPLIKRSGCDFEYIKLDSNIVLGAMPDVDFNIKEIDFDSDDEIFMYTDGVTEALNKEDKLYGEDRLKQMLNTNKNLSIRKICEKLKEDIKNYSQDVEQSDDITMLIFKHYGKGKKYKNIASKENYKHFSSWLKDNLEKMNISSEIRNNIELSFEEIYTNIFSYAYPPFEGEVEVVIDKNDEDIVLQLKDWGIQYNPLEKKDPDINLPPEERPMGGLGIFMVKQLSKSIEYKYENANILTIKF